MSGRIIKAGLQATIQGRPRLGYRHRGMPWAGAADPLSLALANRLVGNALGAPAIEVTYGGFEVEFLSPAAIALTGAECAADLSSQPVPFHQTFLCRAGSVLTLAPPETGVRTYLAIAGGGWAGDAMLGSPSTYLPAALGGHEGRALRSGDIVPFSPPASWPASQQTPPELQLPFGSSWTLRATRSAESDLIKADGLDQFFSGSFAASRLSDRMGVRLEGKPVTLRDAGKLSSAAVFPGTIQCPEDGDPIMLLCDSQTTGGYPRIAHVARCDRHMMGQVRPGDRVAFLHRTPDEARSAYAAKRDYLSFWLGDMALF